ncbi:hypothetical protein [Paracerasibacillus soli]|uniref:Uncharacterized protein n=1 Tax=Paracerasibacillus soli TaxID=480284 RepID=A0ABU5CSS2_9BACI|nr:hypothetical protein [Virgibacillus soli]MDY0408475.1 hypothetical protein [Virgibacillus soli]
MNKKRKKILGKQFSLYQNRYTISDEVTDKRIHYVEEIFDAVKEIEAGKIDTNMIKDEDSPPLSNLEKVQQLKQVLSLDITEKIGDSVFATLVEIPETERKEGRKLLLSSMKDVFARGVRTENLASAKSDVKTAIKYTKLSPELKSVLNNIADFAVAENSFFDVEKTMDAQKVAASNVDPVLIRAGEIIVREGQTITNEMYEKIKLVGLLNKERNIYPLIGLAILIVMLLGIISYEMVQLEKQKRTDKGTVLSILLISFMVVSLMKIVSLYTTSSNQFFYVVPIATGVLLVKLLINERFAIVVTGIYAILGSIIFNGEIPGSLNIEAGIYFYISQLGAIILLSNVKDRMTIAKTGLSLSIINILTALLFIFISFEKYSLKDMFLQSSYGVASALLSAVLTIGLLPFFEQDLVYYRISNFCNYRVQIIRS